jgi:hypothetical protein
MKNDTGYRTPCAWPFSAFDVVCDRDFTSHLPPKVLNTTFRTHWSGILLFHPSSASSWQGTLSKFCTDYSTPRFSGEFVKLLTTAVKCENLKRYRLCTQTSAQLPSSLPTTQVVSGSSQSFWSSACNLQIVHNCELIPSKGKLCGQFASNLLLRV